LVNKKAVSSLNFVCDKTVWCLLTNIHLCTRTWSLF